MTSAETAASAIETTAVSKRYGRTDALHPTTLSVPQGSIFALLGHNGAGKTTLLKMLVNIFPPSAGSATVLGRPSTRIGGDDFTRIGYVSENQDLPGWMTVGAFLRYQSGFYPQWDDAALIRRFELPLTRKLKHLSRGQRMKAALASVLAFAPTLIVLDEPFSGLDPLVRDELIEALLDAAATRPTTIVLSSHDLAEIESFCTHVAFLGAGRLLFAEEMQTLSARFRDVTVTLGPLPPHVTREGRVMLSRGPSREQAAADLSARILGIDPSDTSPSEAEKSASPEATVNPGRSLPWLNLQRTDHSAHFIHTGANTQSIEQQVRAIFPEATDIEIEPMNLRSIFLAIAKASRRAPSTAGDAQ